MDITILLVEDDEEVREAFKDLLKAYGHNVMEADDGSSGFKIWQKHRNEIDLIISDYHMKQMSGEEMLHAMHDVDPEVSVIIVCGRLNNSMDLKKARSVLAKPLKAGDLVGAITSAIHPRERN